MADNTTTDTRIDWTQYSRGQLLAAASNDSALVDEARAAYDAANGDNAWETLVSERRATLEASIESKSNRTGRGDPALAGLRRQLGRITTDTNAELMLWAANTLLPSVNAEAANIEWKLVAFEGLIMNPAENPDISETFKAAYDAQHDVSWDDQAAAKLSSLQSALTSSPGGRSRLLAQQRLNNYSPETELVAWGIENFLPVHTPYLEAAEADYNAIHGEGAWAAHVADKTTELTEAAEGWNFNDFHPIGESDQEILDNYDPQAELASWGLSHISAQHGTMDWSNVGSIDPRLDPNVFNHLDGQNPVADEVMADRNSEFGAAFLGAAEVLYDERNGEGAWAKRVANEGWDATTTDQELASYGEGEVAWFENNLASMAKSGLGLSDKGQVSLLYLTTLNSFTESTWGDLGSAAWRGAVDPTFIAASAASISTAGTASVAAFSTRYLAQLGVRQGIQKIITAGAVGALQNAIEGGLSELALEAGQQTMAVHQDIRKEYDFGAILMRAGMGTVMGAGMGAGFGALGASGRAILGKAFNRAFGDMKPPQADSTDAYRAFHEQLNDTTEILARLEHAGDDVVPADAQALRDSIIAIETARDTGTFNTEELAAVNTAMEDIADGLQAVEAHLTATAPEAPVTPIAANTNAEAPVLVEQPVQQAAARPGFDPDRAAAQRAQQAEQAARQAEMRGRSGDAEPMIEQPAQQQQAFSGGRKKASAASKTNYLADFDAQADTFSKKLTKILNETPDNKTEGRILTEVASLEKKFDTFRADIRADAKLNDTDKTALLKELSERQDRLEQIREGSVDANTRTLAANEASVVGLSDTKTRILAAHTSLEAALNDIYANVDANSETQARALISDFFDEIDTIKADNDARILGIERAEFDAEISTHDRTTSTKEADALNRIATIKSDISSTLATTLKDNVRNIINTLNSELDDLSSNAIDRKALTEALTTGNTKINEHIAALNDAIANLNAVENADLLPADKAHLNDLFTRLRDGTNTTKRVDFENQINTELASPKMALVAHAGPVGSRTDARSVAHFHDNIRDSVAKYIDALKNPPPGSTFSDVARDARNTFEAELIELHQSLNRMGAPGPNYAKHTLSKDNSTIAFGTYERGINLTGFQRDALRVTLNDALKLADDQFAGFTSPANVTTYLQTLANRIVEKGQWELNDDLIIANWKKGKNTKVGNNHQIGIANIGHINQLRYKIEEASNLYTSAPISSKVMNEENAGAKMSKLISIHKFEGNPAYVEGVSSDIIEGISAGMTNADIIYELNSAIWRADGVEGFHEANPFHTFDAIMDSVTKKLVGLTDRNGVPLAKEVDGKIVITDEYRAGLLKRLEKQNDIVWRDNPEMTSNALLMQVLGSTIHGNDKTTARARRALADKSLRIKHIEERYAKRANGTLSSSGESARSAKWSRLKNSIVPYLTGQHYDLVETYKNIDANPIGYSRVWRPKKSDDMSFYKTRRAATAIYRISGADLIPMAVRSIPDHWAGGRVQYLKHWTPRMLSHTVYPIGFIASSSAFGVANTLWYGTPTGLALNTTYQATGLPFAIVDHIADTGVSWGYFSPQPPTPEEVAAEKREGIIETLEDGDVVENALKGAPFNMANADSRSNRELVTAIRERAADLMTAGATQADAIAKAAHQEFLTRGFTAANVTGFEPYMNRMVTLAIKEGFNTNDAAQAQNVLDTVKAFDTRYADILVQYKNDVAAGRLVQPTAGVLEAAAKELAELGRKDAATNTFKFAYDMNAANAFDARKSVFDTLVTRQQTQTAPDAPGTSGARVRNASLDLSGNFNNFINSATDIDGDGYMEPWVATAIGTVKNVTTPVIDWVKDASSDPEGQYTLSVMGGLAGMFLLPNIARQIPILKNIANIPLVGGLLFAAIGFFAAAKGSGMFMRGEFTDGNNAPNPVAPPPVTATPNAPANPPARPIMPPTMPPITSTPQGGWPQGTVIEAAYVEDEDGGSDETGQGSGEFAVAAKANGATIQSHAGSIPRIIEFPVQLDDDAEMESLIFTDEDQDGMFVAQVKGVEGRETFMSPEVIDGRKITSSAQFVPSAHAFNINDTVAAQTVTIELIDEEGVEKKSILTINGQSFEMPIVAEANAAAALRSMEHTQI